MTGLDWLFVEQSADPKRSQEKLFDPEVEFTYSEARNVAMQQSMFSHLTVFIQLVVLYNMDPGYVHPIR